MANTKKVPGKPFKKGQSGNPSGRPKIVGEIRDLARQAAPEAFARVLELVSDNDPRVALAAAQEVLNRAYGKPIQAVEGQIDSNIVVQVVRFGDDDQITQRLDAKALPASGVALS